MRCDCNTALTIRDGRVAVKAAALVAVIDVAAARGTTISNALKTIQGWCEEAQRRNERIALQARLRAAR